MKEGKLRGIHFFSLCVVYIVIKWKWIVLRLNDLNGEFIASNFSRFCDIKKSERMCLVVR